MLQRCPWNLDVPSVGIPTRLAYLGMGADSIPPGPQHMGKSKGLPLKGFSAKTRAEEGTVKAANPAVAHGIVLPQVRGQRPDLTSVTGTLC